MPGNPPPRSQHRDGSSAGQTPSGAPADHPSGCGKDALGAQGEQLAARRLAEAGLEVLERNWSCPDGELDIVARDGAVLVFCEVKTRSGRGFGSPFEAVTAAKARRLRRLASRWLSEHGHRYGSVRFDVVGVLCVPGECARVQHVRGVC